MCAVVTGVQTCALPICIGLPVENGYFVFSGQFSDRDPTNRSGADPRRQFTTVGDPREPTFDRYNPRFGDGKSTAYNFLVRSEARRVGKELVSPCRSWGSAYL